MNNKSQTKRQMPAKRVKSSANKTKMSKGTNNLSLRGSKSSRETAPVSMTRFRSTGSPSTVNLPNGDVIVSHTEYIADVPGSSAFNVLSYPVNPGQSSTFPWLSQMASLYESYKFEDLEFQYQNTCGTSVNGLAMLAIDYDASDPAPVDKTQIASYQGYARDAPWKDFVHKSSRQNLNKRDTYFVRTGVLSANQDIKLYDTGNLFQASQGMSDPQITVGELYVKYRVRLMTPQLQNVAVGLSKSGRYTATPSTNTTVAGSNAPLVFSGDSTSGVVLTATSAFNCLINIQSSVTSGSPVPATAGSTATIEGSVSTISGLNGQTTAQLRFLAGQTYAYQIGANPNNIIVQLAQFNTAVL